MVDIRKPDVVLRPLKRQMVHTSYEGRFPVVARVYFPRGDGSYNHPEIVIGPLDPSDGDDGRMMRPFEITFQRHNRWATQGDPYPSKRKTVAGFMGERGAQWVGCYAARLTVRVEDLQNGYAKHAASILERARKAVRAPASRTLSNQLYRVDCELLTLIVGLRRIGITVQIYSAAVREARARRDARDARSPRLHVAAAPAQRAKRVA